MLLCSEYKYTLEQQAKNAFLIEYDQGFECDRQKRFGAHLDHISGYDEVIEGSCAESSVGEKNLEA